MINLISDHFAMHGSCLFMASLLILDRSTCCESSHLFVSVLKKHIQAIDRQLLLFVPSAG